MRWFSSWSSDVGRTYAATSASKCQEDGRTPELVSGAGEETNKPLIFPRSRPSRNYSVQEHESVLFLATFSGAFIFIPPFLQGLGESGLDPLIGFYLPILLDSPRRQIGQFLAHVILTFSTLLPASGFCVSSSNEI